MTFVMKESCPSCHHEWEAGKDICEPCCPECGHLSLNLDLTIVSLTQAGIHGLYGEDYEYAISSTFRTKGKSMIFTKVEFYPEGEDQPTGEERKGDPGASLQVEQ